MLEPLKEKVSSFFKRHTLDSNFINLARQKLNFKVFIGILLAGVIFLGIVVKDKAEKNEKKSEDAEVIKIDLPDKGLDTEKHWREHFEAQRAEDKKALEDTIKALKLAQDELLDKTDKKLGEELKLTQEKLNLASQELADASLELKKVRGEEKERIDNQFDESGMQTQEFSGETAFDKPKSAQNYIPEGTYFTGNLMGGIVVSTALNTPDENATPVTIRLTDCGNLSKDNKIEISKCRILGSSYGDLSSERAVVRLEKMVCEENGVYTTSHIVGHIYGPDGYNGIKGKVIATSSKHLKNAMLSGLISGFSSTAKGSDSMILSSGGLVSTQKQGAKDMIVKGGLQGVGNAGDKLADYYLRQAESMSPVLMIPAGVRVNAQITKGFFVGEVGTHKRLKNEKQ